jgi:cytochrome c biogenesis protein CcdA
LSYLGFGMLLREILAGLIRWVGPVLRPILNGVTAILCVVLAVLSYGDFRKARRGNTKDMALQLPHRLRLWINKTIRRSMKSETLVTASFVSGVVVSFIELACTGQVYVPIIQGLSNPAYRAQSTLALFVYCLAFVTPLVVVFILSYMGTSSKQLTDFFARYSAPVKLVMALVFLGIGVWLVYDILHVWGAFSPLFAAAASSGIS